MKCNDVGYLGINFHFADLTEINTVLPWHLENNLGKFEVDVLKTIVGK